MKCYARSRRLIRHAANFLKIVYLWPWQRIDNNSIVYGWGCKPSGRFAEQMAARTSARSVRLEDGFIRSVGLGVDGTPSFSLVEDDLGIYYDATRPSRLEQLLNEEDFSEDTHLLETAREAIRRIQTYHVSKYNIAPEPPEEMFSETEKRVLVIAQTAHDASLEYGLASGFSTVEMIEVAVLENPDSRVYIKIHPDVLSGKKRSDLDISNIPEGCCVIQDDLNPIGLLRFFHTVYTKTSQMGFEALLMGKRCVCFGMPFYAGWGVTDDRATCERRTRPRSVEEIFAAAYILYTRYHNPYMQCESDILDTIQTIVKVRDQTQKLRGEFYAFGFSPWKYWGRNYIRDFFSSGGKNRLHFIGNFFKQPLLEKAIQKGLAPDKKILIWGRKSYPEIEAYAQKHNVPILRMEDGFIRSVSLGSDLTRPYSQVVDSRGIYFDPTQESDLEHILAHYDFNLDPALLPRARKLKECILGSKISKYNLYSERDLGLTVKPGQKVIMVPGQVDDDASIRYGAPQMNNRKLLERVRADNPEACIVYKPHPDVLAGNRAGHIPEAEALAYADHVVTNAGIDSVMAVCDEVHTMTSLVGFEALMRGKTVVTYGVPFYAGWGLTRDMVEPPERRGRKLEIDELVAAVYILYPLYVDPKSGQPCEVEVVLHHVEAERARYRSSRLPRVYYKLRNGAVRWGQKLLALVRS